MTYEAVYRKFAAYTVVPLNHFIGTLDLCTRVDVPGAVVECGVWRGGMIAAMGYVLDNWGPGTKRSYYLCDSFEGLPDPTDEDGDEARAWFKREGRMDNAPEDFAIEAMALAEIPTYRYGIVKGPFAETLSHVNPPNGIAILRLDADFYESTYLALDELYPRVNDGGIVIVDDYFFLDGAAKAVHRYLSDTDTPDRIETQGNWKLGEGVAFIRKGRKWI